MRLVWHFCSRINGNHTHLHDISTHTECRTHGHDVTIRVGEDIAKSQISEKGAAEEGSCRRVVQESDPPSVRIHDETLSGIVVPSHELEQGTFTTGGATCT